jgi:hypothetical protein
VTFQDRRSFTPDPCGLLRMIFRYMKNVALDPIDSNARFFELCGYHYWYANHCLQVWGLKKESKFKKDIIIRNKENMSYVFANTVRSIV